MLVPELNCFEIFCDFIATRAAGCLWLMYPEAARVLQRSLRLCVLRVPVHKPEALEVSPHRK